MNWDWLVSLWKLMATKNDSDFASDTKTSTSSRILLVNKEKNNINTSRDFVVNSSSSTSRLQLQILNISWYDSCNCLLNDSSNGFNETTYNSRKKSDQQQSTKSNYSISLQYLENITDLLGNRTHRDGKTNFNDSLEHFDIIFFYNDVSNNNDSFGHTNSTVINETILFTNFYQQIFTAIILGSIILLTIIGNVFVIAAILLEKNLQSVANYLILSLAVADLLVACLVMPIAAIYQISEQWIFGEEICEIWNQIDVLCCTASIFNLVAIALDRFWAVTSVHYHQKRTTKRICLMIAILWALAFLVSIAPMLGLKDKDWQERIKNLQCIVSQDIGYQIFATFASFYVPLLVILFLYWKIFLTARKRIRKKQKLNAEKIMKPVLAVTAPWRQLPTISEATTTTAFTNLSSNTSPEKESYAGQNRKDQNIIDDLPSCDVMITGPMNNIRRKPQGTTDTKRERKAAKTLGIITGVFIFCWSPFFILALFMPISQFNNSTTYTNNTVKLMEKIGDGNDRDITQRIQKLLSSITLWLGYLNSTANPIIYTIFSPEFRSAFKKLVFGRKTYRQNLGLKSRSR